MISEVIPHRWSWRAKAPTTVKSSPERCLSYSAKSNEELYAVRFFTDTAGPSIAGFLDGCFWARLIPQISESELAVRHAIEAIGSLYYALHGPSRDDELPVPTPDSRAARQSFALQSYQRAINATIASLKAGKVNREVALITSLLFFCIETLQRRDTEALVLLHNGFKMLLEDLISVETSSSLEPSEMMQQHIQPLFSRHGVLCDSWDKGLTPYSETIYSQCGTSLSDIDPFSSLIEARGEFTKLLSEKHEIIKASFAARLDTPPDLDKLPILARQRDALTMPIMWWRSRVDKFMARHDCTEEDRIGATVLLSHCYIAQLWLIWGPCLSEMVFDLPNHIETFLAILNAAKSVITYMNTDGHNKPAFTFEMGLIAPLYWTAHKCRHPLIRRKAIALLKDCPTQEGIWVAKHCRKIALRVVGIEEGWIDSDTVGNGPNCSVYLSFDELLQLDPLRTYTAVAKEIDFSKNVRWKWPPEQRRFRNVTIRELCGTEKGQAVKSLFFRLPAAQSQDGPVDISLPLEKIEEIAPP
ncbi:MAG: hypothetical protein Q9227_002013 [Pyrenula ochraceoflavens]